MAYLPIVLDHNVAIVAISNAQDESSDTVTSAGASEEVDGCIVTESGRRRLIGQSPPPGIWEAPSSVQGRQAPVHNLANKLLSWC